MAAKIQKMTSLRNGPSPDSAATAAVTRRPPGSSVAPPLRRVGLVLDDAVWSGPVAGGGPLLSGGVLGLLGGRFALGRAVAALVAVPARGEVPLGALERGRAGLARK
jgi:hypothetical protein